MHIPRLPESRDLNLSSAEQTAAACSQSLAGSRPPVSLSPVRALSLGACSDRRCSPVLIDPRNCAIRLDAVNVASTLTPTT